MTNLERFLLYLGLFAIPYGAILAGVLNTAALHPMVIPLQLLPIALLVLFGLYAATTVLYRTLTFNDCPEAEKELRDQVQQAYEDLSAKNFKFRKT